MFEDIYCSFEGRRFFGFFMRESLKYLLTLSIWVMSYPCYSQNKSYKNEFGFKSENDSFLANGQDRYYTNGLFISFKRAIDRKTLSDSVFTKQHPNADLPLKKIFSVSFGQYMYNAQTGAVPDITYVDRPFAAYLYAAGSVQFLEANENSGELSLQVGTIGPSALGEEVQQIIHHTFGFYELNGWQYQVKDEIGVNAELSFHYFLYRSENKKNDFSLPIHANLGNTFCGLSAGILFRTGILNPFYHSIATQSNVSTHQETGLNEKEFYFFLKPSLNFVAYDATIHGGLFRKDKGPVTFKSNPLVFSQEIGAAYAKKRWTVDFSVIFKSKEEKRMVHSHQYGLVDIYYRFN